MIFKILKLAAIVLLTAIAISFIAFYQADIPVDELTVKYAQPPSQFTEVMGLNVHFRDEGNPNDTIPLVLLHGTSSSLFTWDACTREWIKEHRVVRMDLPGFALTGPNSENDYSISYYEKFIEEFLRSQNIEYCYLAGNSLGGLIAYSYAANHPTQVKKLVLMDPAGYPIANAKGSLAFTLGKIPVIKNLLTVVTPKNVVRKSLEDVYGDKSLVSDELVELYRDMACREGNRQALLIRLNADQKGDTTLVQKIAQPTLLIWGETDQLIPVDNAYKFQRDLPNDTLIVFPQVGHVPMEESPQLVIPVVSGFLKQD